LSPPALEPFFVTDGDTFVPNDIAHGGWGADSGRASCGVCAEPMTGDTIALADDH